MIRIRVFLSSPADVAEERNVASVVLDRLQYDPFVRGRATLDLVAWDKEGAGAPMLASAPPQASVDLLGRPSECDIVIVLFWSKIGTPLSRANYARPDGTAYESGTVWEMEDAIGASERSGTPDVLIYRRSAQVLLDPDSADFDECVSQKRRVDALFDGFRDRSTGSIARAFKSYESPDDFRAELEADLRFLLHQKLDDTTILEGGRDISTVVPAETTWSGSPFPGLRSFTTSDAPIFFGRGRETDQLAQLVQANRFVAVVGSSGSGKSSLVGAGLLPRLGALGEVEGGRPWLVPSFDPGTEQWGGLRVTPGELGGDPFLALAVKLAPLLGEPARALHERLRNDSEQVGRLLSDVVTRQQVSQVVLFVDQFEELFTTVSSDLREPFVTGMESASSCPAAHVVVTLRSDFYHRCVDVPALAGLLSSGGQLPLSTPVDTLLEMITRPAELAALEFEEGLPGRLLSDTGSGAGALALLAYALDELYRRCADSQYLSFEAYRALGGVQGAIGTRAESVFLGVADVDDADLFGAVFQPLVEMDREGRPARRRAALNEIAHDERSRRVVDTFTENRLLVQDSGQGGEAIVSVAHEALFHNWERFHRWIELRRDDLVLLQQVAAAAREWDANGRADAYLWPHERLLPVYETMERSHASLDPTTGQFVRPEAERLFPTLRDPSTPTYQRRATADRLVTIGPSTIPGLVEVLCGADPSAREAAASALVRLGDRAAPALSRALEVTDADVRLAAVAALGQIDDPASIDALSQAAADDTDERVRSAAIGALSTRGSDESRAVLLAALGDRSPDVRWQAVGALGVFGESAVPDLLDLMGGTAAEASASARDALLALGEAACEGLVAGLRSEKPENREAAGSLLVSLGALAVPALTSDTSQDDPDYAWRKVSVLGSIADRRTVPSLLEGLRHERTAVRGAALNALGSADDPQAVPALVRLLEDEDPGWRDDAVVTLAALGPDAVDRLLETLQQSTHRLSRRGAALALSRMAEPPIGRLAELALGGDGADAARWALTLSGSKAAAPLVVLMSDGDDSQAAMAARVLPTLGEPAAFALMDALAHVQGPARTRVVRALAGIPVAGARATLSSLLSDPDDEVRARATSGLAALGDAAMPALLRRLGSSDAATRDAASTALGSMGGPAVPPLRDLARHGVEPARSEAAHALAHMVHPVAAAFTYQAQWDSELGPGSRSHADEDDPHEQL